MSQDNKEIDQELIDAILAQREAENAREQNSAPEISSDIASSFNTNALLNFACRINKGQGGGLYSYCIEEDSFYIYDDGVWRKIFDIELIARVSVALPEITKLTLPMRRQILDNFKIIAFRPLKDFNWTPLLTMQNTMVNPYDGKCLAHDPQYYSTLKLNYKYSPLAKCPLWDKSLIEIFEGDLKRVELLQEFFGYCLVPDVEQKKALLLIGDSNTGKSTILFTLRDLIGQANCSNIPLKYLSNPQYTPRMINKLVNIDADVDKSACNYEAEFKMVTSGEPISCNQKFVETFEFIPKCKIILAANIFPKITDHSSAFYKRLILIPCDRIFSEKEMNRFLAVQLKAELSGILNWALAGLQRLKQRGRFEQHEFMREAVQELEDENNPSNIFFNDHVEVDVADGAYIEKGELFERYKEWCGGNKQYNLSHIQFSRAILKRFGKVTPKQARIGNTGPRIWKNLRYVKTKSASAPVEVTWQDKQENRPNYTV